MIHRSKMRLCKSVEYNHMPMFRYQWEIFYFKKVIKEFALEKLNHDQICSPWLKTVLPFLLIHSPSLLVPSLSSLNRHRPAGETVPSLTIPDFAFFSSTSALHPVLWRSHTNTHAHPECHGVIERNARKDSVHCGCGLGPLSLVMTEKHIHFTCYVVKSMGS